MDHREDLLVGLLVVFSPSLDQVNRIKHIADELDAVYVVDNTENGYPWHDPISEVMPENVRILVNKNIDGIAGALNSGITEAINEFGECYLFLLDQDSCLPELFFKNQYVFAKTQNSLVVAPKYFDINSKTYGNYTKLSKWRFKNIMGDQASEPFDVTFAITSGTLIHSSIFAKIGLFRNDYFIDHVDSEFCVRLQKNGYFVRINPDVVFHHAIGKRIYRRICRISFKPNFHSPLRRYYAVRNGVFMVKEHLAFFPSILLLIVVRISYEYVGILLFEPFKWQKVKALLSGMFDGFAGNKGKCSRNFL